MSRVKETEYFNTHPDKSTSWYEGHFPTFNKAIGEISSNYYLDENVAHRIKDYAPSIRMVINLRDPYDLMESFHKFGIRRGLTLPPLAESMDIPIGKLMGSGYESREKKNSLTVADSQTLLESVCLHDRIQPFTKTTDPTNLHYFVFERLRVDWQKTLSDLYRFIGVDSDFVPNDADRIVNSSVQPKSAIVARLASRSASILRQLGLHGTLAKLHKSETVKKLLFRPGKTSEKQTAVRDTLSTEVTSLLDDQIEKLRRLHPELTQWWN